MHHVSLEFCQIPSPLFYSIALIPNFLSICFHLHDHIKFFSKFALHPFDDNLDGGIIHGDGIAVIVGRQN